jgi:hypothetical protein
VPDRLTACGLPLALSVMLSEAEQAPMIEGVNRTAIVQLPPAANDEPQVVTSVKSVALVPVKATLEMLKLAPPVLVRVMA